MIYNFKKVLFVCGEQLKKIASDWKSNGFDSHDKKFITKYNDKTKKTKLEPNLVIAKAFSSSYYSKDVVKRLVYYQVFYLKNLLN